MGGMCKVHFHAEFMQFSIIGASQVVNLVLCVCVVYVHACVHACACVCVCKHDTWEREGETRGATVHKMHDQCVRISIIWVRLAGWGKATNTTGTSGRCIPYSMAVWSQDNAQLAHPLLHLEPSMECTLGGGGGGVSVTALVR